MEIAELLNLNPNLQLGNVFVVKPMKETSVEIVEANETKIKKESQLRDSFFI